MVDVIVSFRDAVFAALMSWGGVSEDVHVAGGARSQPEAPRSTHAPVEKAAEPESQRLC